MNTVYVCESGSYSDTVIDRIVATEDEAKGFLEAGGCERYTETTVGLPADRYWTHKTLYRCQLNYEGNGVSHSSEEVFLPDGYRGSARQAFREANYWYTGSSIVSPEHAQRLAEEARKRHEAQLTSKYSIWHFGPDGVEYRTGFDFEGDRPDWTGTKFSVPLNSSQPEEKPVG